MRNIVQSLMLVVALSGCANLMSRYDQNTYEAATSLKSQSMDLMLHGNEPSVKYSADIADLQSKLSAQLAYEQGKGKQNVITAKQWEMLSSPDKNLLGGFLKEWSNGKQMSIPYVKEKRIQVGIAYDEILKLEGNKNE